MFFWLPAVVLMKSLIFVFLGGGEPSHAKRWSFEAHAPPLEGERGRFSEFLSSSSEALAWASWVL